MAVKNTFKSYKKHYLTQKKTISKVFLQKGIIRRFRLMIGFRTGTRSSAAHANISVSGPQTVTNGIP